VKKFNRFELNGTKKYLIGLLIALVVFAAQTNWVTASRFNKETGEIKTRVTVVEQKIQHIPAPTTFAELLKSTKRIETLLEKKQGQITP